MIAIVIAEIHYCCFLNVLGKLPALTTAARSTTPTIALVDCILIRFLIIVFVVSISNYPGWSQIAQFRHTKKHWNHLFKLRNRIHLLDLHCSTFGCWLWCGVLLILTLYIESYIVVGRRNIHAERAAWKKLRNEGATNPVASSLWWMGMLGIIRQRLLINFSLSQNLSLLNCGLGKYIIVVVSHLKFVLIIK